MGARNVSRVGLATLVWLGFSCLIPQGSTVNALSNTRTLGEAQSVLEAGLTGQSWIWAGGGLETDPEDVLIKPFADGAAYCASGWHVVDDSVIAFIDADIPEFSFASRGAVYDYFATVQVTFALDGAPLVTQRTAIKPILPQWILEFFGSEVGYWFGVGALLPPGSLSVGLHTLDTGFSDVGGSFTFQITFTVLPC